MKVVVIGAATDASNYDSLVLDTAKNQNNKFGKTYFLKERIFLIQKDPVADYCIWKTGERKEPNLALTLTTELRRELDGITKAIVNQYPEMQFKQYDDKIFLKLGKDCGVIPPNCEIQFAIQIYGAFTQNATGKTFLQLEVHEHCAQKVSLLNKYVPASASGLNYEPNSKLWEDDHQ
jgi:hypothetical protein